MDSRRLYRSINQNTAPDSCRRERQSGQTLVLVALLMVAFIAMLAVILDGGYAYLQKRNAQTAADAGAMAGARELCLSGNLTLASQAAADYAITRNRALEADINIIGGEVSVTTRIPFSTFFGSAIGRPSITSSAIAAADCFLPSAGTGMLPVAWNCSPPVDPGDSESADCQIIYNKLYVIMDMKKVDEDFYCQDPVTKLPPSALDCDFDDDELNDVYAGGDRSWLDLDGGGGGAADLIDWVNGGYGGEIVAHTWFGGQTGVANSVFQAAAARVGDIVLLPVFTKYCDQPDKLPEIGCPGLYDFGQDTTVSTPGAAALYYHVMTFSLFRITCVDAPPYGPCPGHAAAGLPPSAKSIEGVFITGFSGDVSGSGGIDAGLHTLYLTR